jgi:hypothetical protein
MAHAESKHLVKFALEHEAAPAASKVTGADIAASMKNVAIFFIFSLLSNCIKKRHQVKEKY